MLVVWAKLTGLPISPLYWSESKISVFIISVAVILLFEWVNRINIKTEFKGTRQFDIRSRKTNGRPVFKGVIFVKQFPAKVRGVLFSRELIGQQAVISYVFIFNLEYNLHRRWLGLLHKLQNKFPMHVTRWEWNCLHNTGTLGLTFYILAS